LILFAHLYSFVALKMILIEAGVPTFFVVYSS